MTILTVANSYGPRTGGIRTQIDALRAHYAAAGHHSVLVVPGGADADGADASGPVHERRAPRLPLNPDYRNFWDLRPVLRLIDAVRPDVVEIVDKYTLPRLAAPLRRRGVPTVGFSCERLDQVLRPYLGESAALQRAVRGYNAWFVRQFDRVVCHSRYAAAELPGRPRIVPLGVDLARFRPECRDPRVVAELRGDGSLSLLYVGRLVREKRVGVLAGMMRRLAPRGYRLTVVGAGPESDALAGVPGARVLGFVRDAARLAALYASADIFVHPSPIETFGLGVLEALASGCRVVGAADGGVAELLPMGFSRVSGSNAAWAEAVERTARLAAAAASRRAREVAECYPWTATASALLAVHAELAAETARP